jgi:hypothetical protein
MSPPVLVDVARKAGFDRESARSAGKVQAPRNKGFLGIVKGSLPLPPAAG